jgi:hypothetical protein
MALTEEGSGMDTTTETSAETQSGTQTRKEKWTSSHSCKV